MKRSPITKSLFHRCALALTLCLAGGLCAALLPTHLRGDELADKPDRTYTTNGTVRQVVRVGDTIYIGGSFSRVTARTGPGIEVTPAGTLKRGREISGAGPSHLTGSGANVTAVAADGSGGWYVGGVFSHVGAVARTNLVHIRADKSVDPGFNPTLDDSVTDLVVSGSTIYLIGTFTSVDGQPRSRVAAINAVDGSVTAFNPNANASVLGLAVSDDGSTVYVGGYFTFIGGRNLANLAALRATDGSATSFNPVVNGRVDALALSGSTLYMGGTFSHIGRVERNHIGAVSTVDGTVTAFNPGSSDFGCDVCGGVFDLVVSGSTVYASGLFTEIGGQERNTLAALNAADGQALAFNPNPDNTVIRMALSGSTLYVAGGFTSIGGQERNYVAAVNAGSGEITGFNPNLDSVGLAIAVSPSGVYLGGVFSGIGGAVRNNLAALSAVDGVVTSFDPNVPGQIDSLAASDSTLYFGGFFDTVGGQPRANIAAVNLSDGTPTSWNPGCDGEVTTLGLSSDVIYAGGFYFNIGGQPRLGLAALSLSDGTATAFDAQPNNFTNVLTVSSPLVYVGGVFTFIGGQQRNKIVALNESDGTAAPYFDPDLTPTGNPFAIAVSGKTVYIGGSFPSIHGVPRQNIGAVNAGDGLPTSFDPEATTGGVGFPDAGYVFSFAFSGSTVYAGGAFDTIGGQTRNLLAGLDAVTGTANSFNPNGPPGFIMFSLAVAADGTLYAGGLFDTFELAYQEGFAAFSPKQRSLPSTLAPLETSAPNN